jgi:hypothetical protein
VYQDGDAVYSAATPVSQTVDIPKGSVTVSPPSSPSGTPRRGGQYSPTATVSVTGLSATFSTAGCCTGSSVVTFGPEMCPCIVYSQVLESANYNASARQTTQFNFNRTLQSPIVWFKNVETSFELFKKKKKKFSGHHELSWNACRGRHNLQSDRHFNNFAHYLEFKYTWELHRERECGTIQSIWVMLVVGDPRWKRLL